MRKKNFLKIFLVVLVIMLTGGITIAWLSTSLSNSISATASVHKAYFRGEGTDEKPYLIESPAQLYYFAWLQDLGYFNDENDNPVSKAAPVYFEVTNDLDMSEYTLPPAGTSEYPFIGYFDGGGNTISNLTVRSSSTSSNLTDVPNNPKTNNIADSNYQIVGVFGVVGEMNADYSSASFVPTVTNLNIASTTVYSETPKQSMTLVGIVAGYVNAVVEKVTVADSAIKVNSSGLSALSYTENLSDYSLVGYCTEAYRKSLNVNKVTFFTPEITENLMYKNTQDEGAGFGGSMKMDDVYLRTLRAYNAGTNQTSYVSSEDVIFDDATNTELSRTTTGTSTKSTTHSGSMRFYSGTNPEDGSYYFDGYGNNNTENSNNNSYLYVYQTVKEVVYIHKRNEYETGFTITDGTNNLNIAANYTLTAADVTNDVVPSPTGWVMESGTGYIYTYTRDGYKYYLYATTNSLSASETNHTSFTKDDTNGALYFTNNNVKYYIYYNNGWTVFPGKASFNIRSGANYLYNDGSTIGNANNTNNYREWIYDGDANKLYTQYNGTVYYMYVNNGVLTATTNRNTASTPWQVDFTNNKIYFDDANGVRWYLRLTGTTWSVFPQETTYHIYRNTYYLNLSNSAVIGSLDSTVDDIDVPTAEWGLDASNHLYTAIGSTVYYLNVNNSKVLTATTTATTQWTMDSANSIIYTTINNETWYLRCLNGDWSIYPERESIIIYSEDADAYMFYHNGSLVDVYDQESATRWLTDGSNHIYYVENGTKYYLYGTNSLSISSSNSTVWNHNNDGTLSYTYSNTTYYLYDLDGMWVVYPASELSFIYQNGVFLTVNSATTVTGVEDMGEASPWAWDSANHRLIGSYGGTNYYLNAGNYSVSLSTTANTSWYQNGDGTFYYTSGGQNWYLVYDNGWTTYPSTTFYYITDGQDNYLSHSGTTLTNAVGSINASLWINNGSDKYYFRSGGQNYYLVATSNGLSTSTNAGTGTVINYDGTKGVLYFTYDTDTYYIIYDHENSRWTVSPAIVQAYYIRYGTNNYYLSASTTGISTTTSQQTKWIFNSDGTISTLIDGTVYYLRAKLEATQRRSTTNLTVTDDSSVATVWTFNNNALTCPIAITTGGNTSNVTYTLVVENYTFKLWDTSKNHFTYAFNGSTYLQANESAGLTGNNTANTATLWSFSATGNNATTTVSTIINGTTYYLTLQNQNNGTASLTTTSTNVYYYRRRNGLNYQYFIRYSDSGSYLTYTNNRWSTTTSRPNSSTRTEITTSATTITRVNTTMDSTIYTTNKSRLDNVDISTIIATVNPDVISYVNISEDSAYSVVAKTAFTLPSVKTIDALTLASTSVQKIERDNPVTEGSNYPAVFPINASSTSPFKVSDANNGYIVSGGFSGASDMRISRYSLSSQTNDVYILNNALNGGTTFTDSRLEVVTAVNYGDYNGFYRVKDDYNKSNNSISSTLSGRISNNKKIAYGDLGLTRYETARTSLSEMLSGKSVVYGLHFMNSLISKDRTIVLEKAMLNGELKENYEVPNDSIDFVAKMKGYITVFAGTYFTGNTTFFSLHQITRNSDNSIADIKEIREIWSTSGNDYVYLLKDDDGITSWSSDKTPVKMLFDMAWMTEPEVFVNNAVYFFEIPVNPGEYALGSVEGRNGAYLFYLDIGANGGVSEDRYRTTVTEKIREEVYSGVVPEGVQLVESGESYNEDNPYELVTVELSTAFKDATTGYLLTRTGNVVTNQNKTGSTIKYVDGALTISSGGASYYPNGYKIIYRENITDRTRDANDITQVTSTDFMILETVDLYDSSGTFVSRTVTLKAGLDSTDDASNHVDACSFTYNPSSLTDESTFFIRVSRASSYAGFNLCFSQNISISNFTIENEEVHINIFSGENGMTQYSSDSVPSSLNISAYDMTSATAQTNKNKYYKAVYGDELGTYYCIVNYESESDENSTTITSEVSFDPEVSTSSLSTAVTYDFTFTPSSGTVHVYGSKLTNTASYSTYLINYSGDATVEAKTVNYTSITVNVNETALNLDSGS